MRKLCYNHGFSISINQLTGIKQKTPMTVCARDLRETVTWDDVTSENEHVTCDKCKAGIKELLRTGGN